MSACRVPLPTSPAARLESDPVKELAVALLGMTLPKSALQTQRNESLMLEFYVLFDKIFPGKKALCVLLKFHWVGALLLSCLYHGVFNWREGDSKGLVSVCLSKEPGKGPDPSPPHPLWALPSLAPLRPSV